jgi:hypothetical protein
MTIRGRSFLGCLDAVIARENVKSFHDELFYLSLRMVSNQCHQIPVFLHQ